jgi:hypothetical protein
MSRYVFNVSCAFAVSPILEMVIRYKSCIV